MTKNEYAQHLGDLMEEEVDLSGNSLEDQFYGLFQYFMPDGKGIEKVFDPIPDGDICLERIRAIYEATAKQTKEAFERGVVPGYFCPPATLHNDVLIALGEQHINNLRLFAAYTGNNELAVLLNNVQRVSVTDNHSRNMEDPLSAVLYDSFSDWRISNNDYDELLQVLSEAYYAVNCDYFLSAYLQYPRYKNRPSAEFLQPYFEIWKGGYDCFFDNGMLIVTK